MSCFASRSALLLAIFALLFAAGCRAIVPIEGPGDGPRPDTGAGEDGGPADAEVLMDAAEDAGALVCEEGRADCNGAAADGCEADLRSDAAHCGDCGTACGAGERCLAGACRRDLAALEAGGEMTCALAGGEVLCWGRNELGQLAEPSLLDQANPVTVEAARGATEVAVGRSHACALRPGGRILCWGDNTYEQVGPAALGPSAVPPSEVALTLSPPEQAVELTAGGGHSCARTNAGRVFCWGRNDFGQLGDGSPPATSVARPVEVDGVGGAGGLGPAVEVVAGELFTCARVSDGGVYCWGDNRYGQLGDGGTAARSAPSEAVRFLEDFVQLTAASRHACGLRAGGQVACWGYNASGELGDGTTLSPRPTPALLPSLDGVAEVRAHHQHTCARLLDGGLRCWGDNSRGQLGDGTVDARSEPTEPIELGPVVRIAPGLNHTCAFDIEGRIQCWGDDLRGQLGSGVAGNASVLRPYEVPGLASVVQVSLGIQHGCARGADGRVRCWGRNLDGRLGAADPTPMRSHPVVVSALSGATEVVAGDRHTCALAGGEIRCWGMNSHSQLGHDVATLLESDVPVTAATTLPGTPMRLLAGYRHTCGLLSGGSLHCWGWLNGGSHLATMVSGLADISAADAQNQRGCAISASLGDGQIRCWDTSGNSTFGGFGSELVRVSVGGGGHICAIRRTDGSVLCRGDGRNGQLGNSLGSCQLALSPIDSCPPVDGLGGVAEVAAGHQHTCALADDGQAYCWGRNDFGQIGNGDILDQGRPIGIPELTGAFALSSSQHFSCAILGDRAAGGRVYCWGRNDYGQVGAPTEFRTYPRPMASPLM